MSKLQLVLSTQVYTSFDQPWIENLAKDYFDIVYIENNPTIDKKALFVTNVLSDIKWYNLNHKLVIDNLWEIDHNDRRGFVIFNKNWFWYNESLWYRHLNYHLYQPCPNRQKNGLLLMNLKKLHRDWLYDRLDLTKLLYSYVENNVFIDNDMNKDSGEWQRYFNPLWYDTTAFSIVAETTISSNEPLFVTEKTFKPIAYEHPFIVYGQPGILKYLRTLGFETFESVFDESYDRLLDNNVRLDKIVSQVNEYTHTEFDLNTKEKLKHNRNLFFDTKLVKERIIKEIFEPIIEHAET